eukprot:TRINITY_DN16818_c0_g1_i1.p1 TRINITY_DN16818_c0_g1~~TRINITY_DN16818_c0_g1_i1.p1  ORF type:complete len:768 (-),score=122.11 TRINITY_DN16818_c0_g1_i1:272-2293(-)
MEANGTTGVVHVLSSEVLVFSSMDGPLFEIIRSEVERLLQPAQLEKMDCESFDDAEWSIFPQVGAALKQIASREECMVGIFCRSENVQAFGVSMSKKIRETCAQVALVLTLATKADSHQTFDLRPYPQLERLVGLTRQRRQELLQNPSRRALKRLVSHCFSGTCRRRSRNLMRITSRCEGSATHVARRRISHDGEESWEGFCVCCKRPLSMAFTADEPEYSSKRIKTAGTERYAYACAVWGQDPQHILGAMVLAHSLLKTATKHDLICIHTLDVPTAACALLRDAGWQTVEVHHVEASEALFSNPTNRFFNVFTKLRVFGLIQYSKVLLLDTDLLIRENMDSLFDLPAPAAMHRGLITQYEHGSKINGQYFFGGSRPGFDPTSRKWTQADDAVWSEPVRGPWSWGQATGINAGVMLLQPKLETLNQCLSEVADGVHPEHIRGSGPEQDYLSRFFGSEWSHISVAYNFQLHQMYFMLGSIRETDGGGADRFRFLKDPSLIKVFHYSGHPKPWAKKLRPEYASLSDESWIQQLLGDFAGYREFVLKDPTYVEKGCDPSDVPDWAIEAAAAVMSLACRLWEECYQSLAYKLRRQDLAAAVANATRRVEQNPIWTSPWADLSPEQRKAAEVLGWTDSTWACIWLLPHNTPFADLSAEIQESLKIFGEDASSWDAWAP